ncbi:MAG TPA: enoyl-CoA hydratase-related protein [Frankiaceae bacterium]|nr:enoyl-CoA hydratase-related protein [Frankiaceae bacterium]
MSEFMKDAGAGESVLSEIDVEGVALVTLNRPERRNGWTPALEARFFAVMEQLDIDPAVRVVVVTGAGKTFCPGMDTGRLEEIAGKPLDLRGRRPPVHLWRFRKPMIAAVNGACAGVGLVLALACDVRFAAEAARFSTAFARRGLAGEYGATWLLPRLVGTGRASDLLLSARVIDAQEALRIGLVEFVTDRDVVTPALDYARDMALHCAPTSLAMMRHQLHADAQSDFPTALTAAYRAMTAAVEGAAFREGLDSFLEGRPPVFPGLPDDYRPESITGRRLREVDHDPSP